MMKVLRALRIAQPISTTVGTSIRETIGIKVFGHDGHTATYSIMNDRRFWMIMRKRVLLEQILVEGPLSERRLGCREDPLKVPSC